MSHTQKQPALSRRSFLLGGAAAVAGGMLAGCGSNKIEGSGTDTSGDGNAEVDKGIFEGLDTSKTLNIVTTNESYTALFDKFTEASGMKYEILSMSSGEVLSKIKAEGGAPSADLWFGGGIDSFMSAADAGYLEPVDFEDADKFATGFKSDDNLWFSKGVTVVGFIVNEDVLKDAGATAPKAWTDLPDSQYADEIVMSSPAVSGTNYAAVAGILQDMGEDAGWKLLEGINANVPFYTKRGSDPSTRVSQGEFGVGITYIDQTLDDLLNDSVKIVHPSDKMPYIPDGVAAFKGADNTAGAAAFIKWLFSNDDMLVELAKLDKKNTIKLCIPSLEGVELDYTDEDLMSEDISEFGAMREDVLAKWDQVTGGKEIKES